MQIDQIPVKKSFKKIEILHALAEAKLSVEAKAIVAQSFYSGAAQEVSTIIPLKGVKDLDLRLLRQLVNTGWGEELGQFLNIIDVHGGSARNILYKAQLAVRSGAALFSAGSLASNTGLDIFISIHHGLADEHSLDILARLLQVAHSVDADSALAYMRQGRETYDDYVKTQTQHTYDNSKLPEPTVQPMAPVRLRENGSLAFNAEGQRVSLQRLLDITTLNDSKAPIATLLAYLQQADVIAEGNIVCSSHDWRSVQQRNAIGMMTGLVPISLAPSGEQLIPGKTSFETRARYCPEVRQALACCRTSELFINGAGRRGIPTSQVMSATFPVGIEIRQTGTSQLLLEIEGPFCAPSAATELLNELADVLMDRIEWND